MAIIDVKNIEGTKLLIHEVVVVLNRRIDILLEKSRQNKCRNEDNKINMRKVSFLC